MSPAAFRMRLMSARRSLRKALQRSSQHPRHEFPGRRVELRVSQEHVTAVVLDTGELAARQRRVFAGGLTFTARSIRPSSSGSAPDAGGLIRSRSRSDPSLAMTG